MIVPQSYWLTIVTYPPYWRDRGQLKSITYILFCSRSEFWQINNYTHSINQMNNLWPKTSENQVYYRIHNKYFDCVKKIVGKYSFKCFDLNYTWWRQYLLQPVYITIINKRVITSVYEWAQFLLITTHSEMQRCCQWSSVASSTRESMKL